MFTQLQRHRQRRYTFSRVFDRRYWRAINFVSQIPRKKVVERREVRGTKPPAKNIVHVGNYFPNISLIIDFRPRVYVDTLSFFFLHDLRHSFERHDETPGAPLEKLEAIVSRENIEPLGEKPIVARLLRSLTALLDRSVSLLRTKRFTSD